MFTVVKQEYANKTFRMPIGLVKRMEILAQSKGVSLNNLIVQCCEYALGDLNEANKNSDNS